MKQHEPAIAQKVEDALDSLAGINRASANPYLFTRIQQRLANKVEEAPSSWERVAGLLGKPALAFTVVALFLSLNMWAINKKSQLKMAASQSSAEQMFAAEFTGASTTYSLAPTEPNEPR